MKILTQFKGKPVGTDAYGNCYFEEKFLFSKPNRAPRRWVLYKGQADASKVPAEWHGWLHFTYEDPLNTPQRPWHKRHLRNLTGTPWAYVPPTSLTLLSGQLTPLQKPYTAWQPTDKASEATPPKKGTKAASKANTSKQSLQKGP